MPETCMVPQYCSSEKTHVSNKISCPELEYRTNSISKWLGRYRSPCGLWTNEMLMRRN